MLLVETQFVFKFIYLHKVLIITQINITVISSQLQTAKLTSFAAVLVSKFETSTVG